MSDPLGKGTVTVAVALADALAAARIVREVRQLEVRDGDRDDVTALAAEHLLLPEVPAQLLAHAAAHDLPEPVEI